MYGLRPWNAVLAVAAAVTMLTVALPVAADHFSPVQPGARIGLSGGWCTMNYIFRDPAGSLYVGTAGHCVTAEPLGTRASVAGTGEFGSLAFKEVYSDPLHWMDFALFRIDPDKHALVDPSMRVYGGPTAVQNVFTPGTPTFVHGYGAYLQTTEFTRAFRPGVLEYVKEDPAWVPNPGWFFATNAVYAGDSGGPVLTADGKALGIVTTLSIDDLSPVGGPTVKYILEWMAERGWALELVTAPYAVPDMVLGATVGLAQHCLDQPVGTRATPDACVLTDGVP